MQTNKLVSIQECLNLCITKMSPGANSQNNKSKASTSTKRNVNFNEDDTVAKNRSKAVDEGEDFDVVESDPDDVQSSSEEDQEPQEEQKLTKRGKAKKEAARVKKRLEEISQVKIGIREFLGVLDWYMLSLFVKSLFYFVVIGLILSLIYLCFVFCLNEDLWYEYFPPSDDNQQFARNRINFDL